MNDLSMNQISTVVNEIVSQATGKEAVSTVTTSNFVSVAHTALLTGYDNVINAISQVLSRTIFSVRPYTRKFGDLQVSNIRYGNHIRKIQTVDKPFENDNRISLTDGQAIDMYKVNKPDVLQTNFYGETVFQKSLTIFKDQLDTAFRSPEEFGQFISMIMSNASDMIEQAHETLARETLVNLIGGVLAIGNAPQIVHLITDYNAETGLSLTKEDVMSPDNFPAFSAWAYAKVASVSAMLTERTVIYHQNITDKEIARHTPMRDQLVYLYAPTQYQISARVLADAFHDNYLRYAKNEAVNFWQSATTPDKIDANVTYLQNDGSLVSATASQTGIFGVIFDREAAGYTVVNQWSAPTPFNASGGYTNMFWHFTDRYWNDFTENAVVFLLN